MFMRFLFRVGLECMLKDEQIELFAVLRSCVFSPMGLNILAQGKAKRRAGCRPNLALIALKGPNNLAIGDATTLLGPFRATFRRFVVPPGRRFATFRRCALPWANMLLPHSGRKLYDLLASDGVHMCCSASSVLVQCLRSVIVPADNPNC